MPMGYWAPTKLITLFLYLFISSFCDQDSELSKKFHKRVLHWDEDLPVAPPPSLPSLLGYLVRRRVPSGAPKFKKACESLLVRVMTFFTGILGAHERYAAHDYSFIHLSISPSIRSSVHSLICPSVSAFFRAITRSSVGPLVRPFIHLPFFRPFNK